MSLALPSAGSIPSSTVLVTHSSLHFALLALVATPAPELAENQAQYPVDDADPHANLRERKSSEKRTCRTTVHRRLTCHDCRTFNCVAHPPPDVKAPRVRAGSVQRADLPDQIAMGQGFGDRVTASEQNQRRLSALTMSDEADQAQRVVALARVIVEPLTRECRIAVAIDHVPVLWIERDHFDADAAVKRTA